MKALLLSTVLLAASLQSVSVFAADSPQRPPARQGGKIYGDATRGKEIVEKWCVTCHSVGAPTDDRVPALSALAANPSKTDGVIRAFLMQPHRPMPPLELSTQQIEDIVAYLASIRATANQAR